MHEVKTGITRTPIHYRTRRDINGIINPDCGCWNYVPGLEKPYSFSGRLHNKNNNCTVQYIPPYFVNRDQEKLNMEAGLKSEKNERMENFMFFCLPRSLPRSYGFPVQQRIVTLACLLLTKDSHPQTFFCCFNM